MRSAVWRSLKGNKNGNHWEELAGYSFRELKKHLARHFLPGMTWSNFGKEWHIDHIKPMSVFNIATAEDIDFKKCWDLKNLQPLWKQDNLRKRNKLNGQHQPSFAFGRVHHGK